MRSKSLRKHRKSLFILVIFILFCLLFIYLLFSEFSYTPSKPAYFEKIYEEQFIWQEHLSDIRNLILEKFNEFPKEFVSVSLEKTIDIDGDNINEALVNLNYGGAATENYLWLKTKNGMIQIVKFKEKDGSIKEKIFTQGIGGGGRYGFEFDSLTKEKTIFQASFYAYNSPEDFCKVEAYIYNPNLDLFEYNEEKSRLLTENYCRNLCQSINDELKEYFNNICQ